MDLVKETYEADERIVTGKYLRTKLKNKYFRGRCFTLYLFNSRRRS